MKYARGADFLPSVRVCKSDKDPLLMLYCTCEMPG